MTATLHALVGPDNIVRCQCMAEDGQDVGANGFLVSIPEGSPVNAGWVYANGSFSPPAPKAVRVDRIYKGTLVDRLEAVGLLSAAFQGLGGPGTYLYERWQASQTVDCTDARVIGLLTAIGGDLDVLLAPDPTMAG